MLEFIADHPVRLILALIIGIATAWWMWGRREGVADEAAYYRDGDRLSTPLPDPEELMAERDLEADLEAEWADDSVLEVGADAEIAIDPDGDPDDDPYPLARALASTAAMTPGPEEDARPNIAAAVGESDDLTQINGIGPKLLALCNALGVRRFDQIAKWSDEDVAEVDAYLGGFRGRIARDNWVAQARLLSLGHIGEWEARYGYKG